MEKLKLRKDIGKEKTFDADAYTRTHTPIDEVIEWLKEAKTQGATHIDWGGSTDYDGIVDEVNAQAFYEYIESDEDLLARIEKEKQDNEKKEKNKIEAEIRQYEKLKEKYEKQK